MNFELYDLINVIDKEEMEATSILNKLNLPLTGENYSRLKYLLLANGCERKLNEDRHVAYVINEMNLRKELAQSTIRKARTFLHKEVDYRC